MKLCWVDIRAIDDEVRAAVLEEAVHQRIDAIVSDHVADLTGLPPTVKKVLLPPADRLSQYLSEGLDGIDIVLLDEAGRSTITAEHRRQHPGVSFGRFVEIIDADTLELACQATVSEPWSLLWFRDPTKIPLEIVLAAAEGASGQIITVVSDIEEAEIVFGVLEHGSDGVLMAAHTVGEATGLKAAADGVESDLDLVELTVTGISHVGMGQRACIDTCSYLREDEGMLIGSHSKGMILCVSETHPLPYMPTRPFRVNAGAIHSYTMSKAGRTNYLSDLKSGSKVLAVDVKGQTRLVTVGRVKIESRPLLQVDAISPDGRTVNLILQDDWHVRVLGPGGVVYNSTHLQPGDILLGYLPTQDRHVGYPINEFCLEQ